MAKKTTTRRIRKAPPRPAKRSNLSRTPTGSKGRKAAPKNPGVSKRRPPTTVRRKRPSQFRARSKRTFQLTENIAAEKISFKSTKGNRPTSNTENVKKILSRAIKKGKKKFSRKKADRYAARVTLTWTGTDGKRKYKTLVKVSDSFESAIEKILEDEEINSLTYEKAIGPEDKGVSKTKRIGSKTKRVVGVAFDKYVERKRKVSKTARRKKR